MKRRIDPDLIYSVLAMIGIGLLAIGSVLGWLAYFRK